jgi:ectoine hydroxylase-related dioxygenase (phytanoyl-CoA dioxygenase family)
MNDCYGTKSMSILDMEQTGVALEILRAEGYERYEEYAAKVGKALEVPFGSACIFWAGLSHTIPVNETKETRWTFNHRFKSYWAPYGRKGSGYFDVLKLSPLTEMGLKEETAP